MKTTKSQKRAKAAAAPKKTIKAATKPRKPRAKKGKGFKLEAKPLTEAQIKMFLEHFNENGSFPGSKIPCNITGKLTTCVGPWMRKKIAEFGGAENLLRKYICRGAVKKHAETQKAPSKRKATKKALKSIKVDDKVWDLPKVDINSVPLPLSSAEISDLTYSTCLRPDLHLDNDYACNGCEFFDACTSRKKCINKKLGLVATRKVRKAA
jgi:hypothetical protein